MLLHFKSVVCVLAVIVQIDKSHAFDVFIAFCQRG
jgi:hypothetical protein